MSSSEQTLSLRYRTLVEALAAAPAERPFVAMWKDEDELQTVMASLKNQDFGLELQFENYR